MPSHGTILVRLCQETQAVLLSELFFPSVPLLYAFFWFKREEEKADFNTSF